MAYIVSTPTCMPEPTWYAGPMQLGGRGNGWSFDMYDPFEEEYAPSLMMSYAAQREAAYRAEMQRRRRQAELQRQYEIELERRRRAELERRRTAELRRRQREAQAYQRMRRQQQRELAGLLEHLTLHELLPMTWLTEEEAHESELAQRHEEAERRRAAQAKKQQVKKQQTDRPALESKPQASEDSEHIYIDLGNGLRLRLSPMSTSLTQREEREEREEEADEHDKDLEPLTGTENPAKAASAKPEAAEPESVEPESANKGKQPEQAEEEHNEEANVNSAAEEPVAKEQAAPVAQEQQENTAAAKDTITTPVSLCNYAFPTGDYGKLVRKQVNVDKIDVEADPLRNTIRISGLWAKERPNSRSSSPRSPHVRDVDEFGEEVLLPEDSDTSDSESSDKVVFDHAEVVDVPANADLRQLRAELTDNGFALWLDHA